MKEHIQEVIQKKQIRKIEILKYVQKQAKVENDTFMDREPKEFEFAFSHGIKIDQPVPNPNYEIRKRNYVQPFFSS